MKIDDWFSVGKVVEIGESHVVIKDVLTGETTTYDKKDLCNVDDNCISIRIPEETEGYETNDGDGEGLASGLRPENFGGSKENSWGPGENGSGEKTSGLGGKGSKGSTFE